jgi:hypothetical protein
MLHERAFQKTRGVRLIYEPKMMRKPFEKYEEFGRMRYQSNRSHEVSNEGSKSK